MVQEYEDNIIPPPLEFRDGYKPIPKPRTIKPIPAPRKNVKQMVQEYEDNIIPPIPKPRTIKPVPAPLPCKDSDRASGQSFKRLYKVF